MGQEQQQFGSRLINLSIDLKRKAHAEHNPLPSIFSDLLQKWGTEEFIDGMVSSEPLLLAAPENEYKLGDIVPISPHRLDGNKRRKPCLSLVGKIIVIKDGLRTAECQNIDACEYTQYV